MLQLAHRGVAPATLDDVSAVVAAEELLARRQQVDATDSRRRGRRVRRRARPAHARAAERLARRQPACGGAPARGGQGVGAARRPRVRDARRRRVVARPVLRHRLLLSPEAELERYRPDDAVQATLASVAVPR